MSPGAQSCETDIDLVQAHGVALALIGRLLELHGLAAAGEFGTLLGLMAKVTGEAYPRQGDILATWSDMVSDDRQSLSRSDGAP
jgi:hypothetical protein